LTQLEFLQCSLKTGHWANVVDKGIALEMDTFVLSRVNEVMVKEQYFHTLADEERSNWTYSGQIKVNAAGRRYFVSIMESVQFN
jgi:hypothetical protein